MSQRDAQRAGARGAGAPATPRTSRGTDRREHIIAAALETIIELGVHGTSQRTVAERASVPLGSMTYYFSDRTEVLEEAFALLHRQIADEHRDLLGAARSRDAAIDAIVELISGDRGPTPAQMRGLAEMYAFANRNQRVAALSRDWLCVTADTLAPHFPSDTAAALDALMEGWNLHRAFVGAPPDRSVVERAVRGLVEAGDPERHAPGYDAGSRSTAGTSTASTSTAPEEDA